MTKLSVNINKIALLRNSRGRNYPSVVDFAGKFIALGAHGITIHPRQDQRHITNQDALDLAELLAARPGVELNIEGYPCEAFLDLVDRCKPDQCTLVPDAPDQLTSDHGWDFRRHGGFLRDVLARIGAAGTRTAAFLDPDLEQVELAAASGADRIELYTETYAASYGTPGAAEVFDTYARAAALAQRLGLGVNAGHDLDLANLPRFLQIDGILEVSIGHALTVECIEQGMASVMRQYLDICAR
jgi:pyridoxine 5-phosphate synthase